MEVPAVTICCLLHGNYPELATRCLGSLTPGVFVPGALPVELRVGLATCGHDTRNYVFGLSAVAHQEGSRPGAPFAGLTYDDFPFRLLDAPDNPGKYVVMRRLLHEASIQGPFWPPPAALVMWFDDDSYVKAADAAVWLRRTVEHFHRSGADVLGSVYTLKSGLQGGQPDWVRSRPWYGGKPVARGTKTPFATGGWWLTRWAVLRDFNWPDPDLVHLGGDYMFGELCRQQGLKLVDYKEGVAINADLTGRESSAERRGLSRRSQPVGMDFKKEG